MLKEISPSTHRQMILSINEIKPSTDYCARNTPSSMLSIVQKLGEKIVQKEVKYGTMEGLDGPSLQSSTQMLSLAYFS